MNTNRFEKIILRLIEKTTKNEIIWNKSTGENEFMASFSASAITIDKFYPDGGFESYDLIIFNSNGQAVDRFLYITNDLNADDNIKKIKLLYELAYSSYFQIDDTYDSLLHDLE